MRGMSDRTLCVAAAGAVLVSGCTTLPESRDTAGEELSQEPETVFVMQVFERDQDFTVGTFTVRIDDAEAFSLRSITVGTTSGVEVGEPVLSVEGQAVSAAPGVPADNVDPDDLLPASSPLRVDAGEYVQTLIPLTVTGDDLETVAHVELEYELDGVVHEAAFPFGYLFPADEEGSERIREADDSFPIVEAANLTTTTWRNPEA